MTARKPNWLLLFSLDANGRQIATGVDPLTVQYVACLAVWPSKSVRFQLR